MKDRGKFIYINLDWSRVGIPEQVESVSILVTAEAPDTTLCTTTVLTSQLHHPL